MLPIPPEPPAMKPPRVEAWRVEGWIRSSSPRGRNSASSASMLVPARARMRGRDVDNAGIAPKIDEHAAVERHSLAVIGRPAAARDQLDAVRDGSSGDRDDLFARGRRHDRVGDAPAQRFAQKRAHGRPIAAHRRQRLRIVAVGDRPDRAAKPRQPSVAFGIAFCHGFGHL